MESECESERRAPELKAEDLSQLSFIHDAIFVAAV